MMHFHNASKKFNAIVKVQRPIVSNDPREPWLVYNRDKTVVKHVPAKDVPSNVKSQMGDKLKAHFLAKIRNGNIVAYGGTVQGEGW